MCLLSPFARNAVKQGRHDALSCTAGAAKSWRRRRLQVPLPNFEVSVHSVPEPNQTPQTRSNSRDQFEWFVSCVALVGLLLPFASVVASTLAQLCQRIHRNTMMLPAQRTVVRIIMEPG